MKLLASLMLSYLLVCGLLAEEETGGANGEDEAEVIEVEEILETLVELVIDNDESKAKILKESKANPNTQFEKRFEKGMMVLEELAPEFSEISNSLEELDILTRFSKLPTALAKYHDANPETVGRLSEAITQLVNVVPEDEHSVLHSNMRFFSRTLVTYVGIIHGRISDMKSDTDIVLKAKDSLLMSDPDFNVGFADKFVSCVNSLEKKSDKEFTNLFSSLGRKMERATKKINGMDSTDKKYSRKLFKTVDFTSYLNVFSKIRQRVLSRNCYRVIDVDRLLRAVRE